MIRSEAARTKSESADVRRAWGTRGQPKPVPRGCGSARKMTLRGHGAFVGGSTNDLPPPPLWRP
jgi:hypothetical protein